ncbi:HD domain-containing protein [Bosea sp. (in: a-proteobacteria)]|uniref:HD domain-containing protein n=1 Tax=Bosea sp. (in: a-proteobacteria) TaxID=1871050 RepID=UPI0027359E65|nr:HD domain-containing protein [Bosea sp. (in: a-proteobacteria)]MDP3255360.1 HD domain-containing protein [Bosea sp. (in: a-proteobacteria)]
MITFDLDLEVENVLWRVLETRPFQRLRRVKQLGFSDLVYPGASHSRFAHSIGVFHTARQLLDVVHRIKGDREVSREKMALSAALIHDLGHGPFSHAFEKVGERLGLKLADHEHVSDLLIRNGEVAEILNEISSAFAIDVADMVKKEGRKTVHNAVVSSQFDADRLDYMRRDRLMSGTQHAAIDFAWLMANLEIASVPIGLDDAPLGSIETFVIGPKAIHAAEAYVLGLFQLYPTVYFHKATRGAEKIFTELLVRMVNLARGGIVHATGLPVGHPLIRFALNAESLESALCLDDSVVWGALSLMAEASDAMISELATRLRDRKLYKCIDVRSRIVHEFDPDSTGDSQYIMSIETCCANVNKKLSEWINDKGGDSPRVILDEAARSPYKVGEGSKGPAERINVRTEGGQLVDLKMRSRVVAGLADFRLFRAYYNESDSEARSAITQIIDSEVAACRSMTH